MTEQCGNCGYVKERKLWSDAHGAKMVDLVCCLNPEPIPKVASEWCGQWRAKEPDCKDRTEDYAIVLQKAIQCHCRDEQIPWSIEEKSPFLVKLLNENWRKSGKAQIAAADKLCEALQALGCMPDGYCFCHQQRDSHKPEGEHTGECLDATRAITVYEKAKEQSDD